MSVPKGQTTTTKTYDTNATPGLSGEAEQMLHEKTVLEHLTEACGVHRIAPQRPFASVQDFYAHVLGLSSAPNERAKAEQLKSLSRAVQEAEHGRVPAAATCIGNAIGLGVRGGT